MYIIYVLTHVKKNQIKEKFIVESQAYCEGKQETSIHEILSNGLYSWLGTFEVQPSWLLLLLPCLLVVFFGLTHDSSLLDPSAVVGF